MQKLKSPVFSLILVFALVLSAISIPGTMQAKQKNRIIGLSASSMTMCTGSVYTLKTSVSTNQLTFSSKKTKVAVIDANGVITAKKNGKTMITVRNKQTGKQQKFTLNVKKPAGYTISKTSGSYSESITVTLKAKKGYKVFYTIGSSFQKKTYLKSGRSKKFTFSSTQTLRVLAVRSSKKMTVKKLRNAKPGRFYADYMFKIPADNQLLSSSVPSSSASPSQSSAPTGNTLLPTQSTIPSMAPTGSIVPPIGSITPDLPSSSPTDVTDGSYTPAPGIDYDEQDTITDSSNAIAVSILSENSQSQDVTDTSGNILYSISKKNKITISKSGTYRLSGTSSSGRIEVDVDGTTDTGIVHLILAGVNLTSDNTDGVLSVKKKTARVIVTLEENTTNVLTDTAQTTTETSDTGTTETIYPDGALVCRQAPLTINGSGTLSVSSTLGTGVKATGALKIMSGNITVTNAGNNGIFGKTALGIQGGKIQVTSDGDGIKTTTPDDTALGHMNISNADITITSYEDAIQSYGGINFSGGNFELSSTKNTSKLTTIEGETKDSFKGIKTSGTIVINGGTYNITSSDDTVHTNDSMSLAPGTMTLSSGDDGIHADDSVQISSGTLRIEKCYEGIEGANITISGGDISIIASDDGINGAGGTDSETGDNGFGGDNFGPGIPNSSSSNYQALFSGGSVYINATGDGIDVNGNIYMTGGNVYVDGPTNSGNGALDYDGTFEISGGTLVAVGSVGMDQMPSDTSTQPSIRFQLSQTQSANTPIALKDASDQTLLSHTPQKVYQSVVVSSPDLQIGNSYSLYVNQREYSTVTLSSINTGGGSSSGPGGGNFPGGRP